ncbi:ubiquinone biosynthesis accessory factor UbiJ [Achromobacter anxifer]|uniref:Ubiquinone biosynthesis accessory factor UbiJ n=1 Tax=Achromobacter anxifer TaxID=1287737 RepID=A0A6S7EUU3_9BURK|nr:SCP2 sterol-binding domain-containing protein [Achromobacter anxifer]MDF8360903.1 SCP2 sterol-binding domain-containing protein [Achromobacter anxifer]CAB3928363.1 Ubiquinone biosynthesis accessory factor UbiJ [Achromobacter anxifer]
MLPFPFLPTPSRLAVSALNALLRREDWARDRLARHAGKTVRFALGGFALGLTIDSEGLAAQADAAVVPDVTLTVAPEKLPLPRLGAGRETPDFAEATHISGDAALAQVVADLSKQLRWDPEDALARVVGDIAALRIVGGARAAAGGVRTSSLRLAENVSEYLSEESGMLAGRPALEQWRLDLAELNTRADALARSAAALQTRLASASAKRGA